MNLNIKPKSLLNKNKLGMKFVSPLPIPASASDKFHEQKDQPLDEVAMPAVSTNELPLTTMSKVSKRPGKSAFGASGIKMPGQRALSSDVNDEPLVVNQELLIGHVVNDDEGKALSKTETELKGDGKSATVTLPPTYVGFSVLNQPDMTRRVVNWLKEEVSELDTLNSPDMLTDVILDIWGLFLVVLASSSDATHDINTWSNHHKERGRRVNTEDYFIELMMRSSNDLLLSLTTEVKGLIRARAIAILDSRAVT